MSGFSKAVVAQIVYRDGSTCAHCGSSVNGERGRDWAVHHRLPRAMGGSKKSHVNASGNGVLLHTRCHEWLESNRSFARARGVIVAHGQWLPVEIPVKHAVHGWCRLDDEGLAWVMSPVEAARRMRALGVTTEGNG